MNEGMNKNHLLLAGITTAAMAAAVVGHMFAIDWFGQKLRRFVRTS